MVLNSAPSGPNQTKPTWPTYLTYFPDPSELHSHLTYQPTWPTYPSVCPTQLHDFLTHPYNLPKPTDNLPEPTDNLRKPSDNLPEPTDNLSHYRHHNVIQIPQLWPNVTFLTNFYAFDQNWTILTKFRKLTTFCNFDKIFTVFCSADNADDEDNTDFRL